MRVWGRGGLPTGRNRRTFGAVSKWEGAGVQQRREAGRGAGVWQRGLQAPSSVSRLLLVSPARTHLSRTHTCHARTHLQLTSQDSTGAGRREPWGPSATPSPRSPSPLSHQPPALPSPGRQRACPDLSLPAGGALGSRVCRDRLASTIRRVGFTVPGPHPILSVAGVHGATARPPVFPSGPAWGGGCVLSVCPLFPGHQGLTAPPPLQRRGAGEPGGEGGQTC